MDSFQGTKPAVEFSDVRTGPGLQGIPRTDQVEGRVRMRRCGHGAGQRRKDFQMTC